MRKIEIDMTPMIDIVFQLLIFFVMTLNIQPPEGQLAMQIPAQRTAASAMSMDSLPPMILTLKAGPEGECSEVLLDQRAFAGEHRWEDLHNYVARLVGRGDERADVEVQIVADYDLKHEHTVQAISALSGSRDEQGKIHPLIEKIGFAPPNRAAATGRESGGP
jgi:biopolymer transport protein ExbD